MKELLKKNGRSINLVKVLAAKSQTSKNGRHQIVLSVENGDEKPIAIFFTDNGEGTGMATRIDKLSESSPIIGTELWVDLTEGSNGIYFANAFQLRRKNILWKLGTDDDAEYVLAGRVTGLRDWNGKSENGANKPNLEVQIPVDKWDAAAGKEIPTWYRVNFFGDNAEAVRNQLSGEKVSAAIVCDKRRDTESNGKKYTSFLGHNVTVL